MEISAFKFQMNVNPSASIQQAKPQITFQKSKTYIIYCYFIQFKILSESHMYLCNQIYRRLFIKVMEISVFKRYELLNDFNLFFI